MFGGVPGPDGLVPYVCWVMRRLSPRRGPSGSTPRPAFFGVDHSVASRRSRQESAIRPLIRQAHSSDRAQR
jgi:hypothetical protein